MFLWGNSSPEISEFPQKFWKHGMLEYQERCLNHIWSFAYCLTIMIRNSATAERPHDMLSSASEVTTIWRYTNVYIIIIIIMLVNLCHVSQCMGARIKRFKQQQWPSMWCKGINGAIRYSICHIRFPISVLLRLCLYLAPLMRYYHLLPKTLRGRVTANTSLLGVIHCACTSTPLYQSAHNIWSA